MYTFLTELQSRPDGIINSSVTSRSSLANGLALYYERASKAVTSTQFVKVALTLQDADGTIIENRAFETMYEEPASKSVANGSATAPASISGTGAEVTAGTNTLTLTKSVSVTPTVSPGYVASGTVGNADVSLTAPVPTKAAATITPGTSAQEIAGGTYLTGKQTIAGDPNLVPSKIVYPNSIFGVAGTAKMPVISQDATTKVLTIS